MQGVGNEVAAVGQGAKERSKLRNSSPNAHRSVARWFAAACVIAVVLIAKPAHADDPSMAKPTKSAARDRLSAGNKLYRIREFEKAAEEYKAGALIEDVPVFYYNLGQCYRQLDRYEDAIWHYERFIERGKPTGQLRGAVDAFLIQLNVELQRKAAVPAPVEPTPGLKASEPPPPPPKIIKVTISGQSWYRDRLGWGLASAGAVVIGVSGWLLIGAKGIEDDANSQAAQSAREHLRDRATTRRITGSIVGGVGLAALVTGIVKLAMSPADREETVTTSFNVGVSSDTVFVAGRF